MYAILFFAWIAVRSAPGFAAWYFFWGVASGLLVVAPISTLAHPALVQPESGVLGSRMGMA